MKTNQPYERAALGGTRRLRKVAPKHQGLQQHELPRAVETLINVTYGLDSWRASVLQREREQRAHPAKRGRYFGNV